MFAQLAEPKQKDGIWIKTEEVISTEESLSENTIFSTDGGAITTIDTDIYIFRATLAYKYDTITGKLIVLETIPETFVDSSSAVAVGTDIYLFGGQNNNSSSCKKSYKYDTLTDTYTKLTDMPYSYIASSAVAVGTDIYLFGDYSYHNYTYKYNTITGEYTKLANMPYKFSYGSAVLIDNTVYLIGSAETNNYYKFYKYDILTNTYIQLTDTPFECRNVISIAVGTDIYLFGNFNTSDRKRRYKYDTLTEEYIQLENLPFDFYNCAGVATSINSIIYMFIGGQTYIYDTRAYFEEISKYEYNKLEFISVPVNLLNGNIYIIAGTSYKTNITDKLILRFFRAFLYKDSKKTQYPVFCRKWYRVDKNRRLGGK